MLWCISGIMLLTFDCSTGKSRLTRLSARDTPEASSGSATLLQLPETAAGMEGAEHHLQVGNSATKDILQQERRFVAS